MMTPDHKVLDVMLDSYVWIICYVCYENFVIITDLLKWSLCHLRPAFYIDGIETEADFICYLLCNYRRFALNKVTVQSFNKVCGAKPEELLLFTTDEETDTLRKQ